MIEVRRGDDLNAFGKEYVFVLNVEDDSQVKKAIFEVDNFRQEWSNIVDKRISLQMTREDTYKLKLGKRTGYLKVYDENGLAETLNTEITFNVLDEVVKNDE